MSENFNRPWCEAGLLEDTNRTDCAGLSGDEWGIKRLTNGALCSQVEDNIRLGNLYGQINTTRAQKIQRNELNVLCYTQMV